jgi:hypothetical protein
MAGGVLKGFGITFLVLGILLVLAGLAAAAYGLYTQEENDGQLLGDPEAEDQAQTALVAGAAAAAVGLLVLVLGIALNAAGNGRRHRELLRAAAGRPADAPAPAPPAAAKPATAAAKATAPPAPATTRAARRAPGPSAKTGAAIGLASLGILVLAVLALALGDGGRAVGFGGDDDRTFQPLSFQGSVRNSFALPGADPVTTDDGESLQEFDAPAGATTARIELTWDRADAGADQLVVVLEHEQPGDGWRELGRASGTSPVSLEVTLDPSFLHLRYRVVPAGSDPVVAEQPFEAAVSFA